MAKKILSMENCQLYGSGWKYYPLPMEAGLINAIYNRSQFAKKIYSKCRGYKGIESIVGATTEQIYQSGVLAFALTLMVQGKSRL